MTSAARRRAKSPATWLIAVAIVLIAINLRGPIVATAPVIALIKSDLGLTALVAGLLTSIPVLCFAVASPFASAVVGRFGAERSVTISLLGIVAGTLIRSAGGSGALIGGTIVLGVSITVGNVVLPVVIRRDFSAERVGFATGIYTSAINLGSMITSLGTAPIAEATGWSFALVVWGVFALIAGIVWFVAFGVRPALLGRHPGVGAAGVGVAGVGATGVGAGVSTGPQDLVTGPVEVITASIPVAAPSTASSIVPGDGSGRSLFRRASTWGLTLAFAGQAFGYYGLTAWIPTLLHDEVGLNTSGAGASSSVFQIMGVVGALGVPFLALRLRPVVIIGLVSLFWCVIPVGLLAAPQLWLVWSLFGGAAQGGGITIVFIIIVRMATSDLEARRLSALVQGGGYAIASLGPLVVGAAHDASHSWTGPMLIVLTSVVTLGVSGALSARRVR